MTNHLKDALTVSPNLALRLWNVGDTLNTPDYSIRSLNKLISLVADRAVVDINSNTQFLTRYHIPLLDNRKELNTIRPFLAYDYGWDKPPIDFFDERYLAMTPEQKSDYMNGNIGLAAKTVFWTVTDRIGTWPSLVDSKELKKLVSTELKELIETDVVVDGEQSPLRSALSRDKSIIWHKDPDAKAIWDVASEVADLAFCSLQYWQAYDSFDIGQCEQAALRVTDRFDRQVDPHLNDEELIAVIHDLSIGNTSLGNHSWPEMILGLTHLLAKRMGVDLWEMLTLKCLANERHYPNALQLVEPDRVRRMDEARTSAWVFAKNTRKSFSEDKRFIPPMDDWLGGPTVLDQIYDSPYQVTDWVCLVTMLEQLGYQDYERVIFDSSGVEGHKAYYPN